MKQQEAERADIQGGYTTGERLAGAFIIVAILLLISALAFSSQVAFLFADTFTLHAEIETAEGVSDDAIVKFKGIEIGQVTDVELTPARRVALTMKIREKYHDIIRQDSVATLNHLAILGDVTIDITRGDPGLPPLEDGATIPVRETPPLDVLLARLAPMVEDVTATAEHARAVVEAVDPAAVKQITDDLGIAVADIRHVMERINSGKGTIGRLLSDEDLAADIADSADKLAESLELAQARLRGVQPLIETATARTEEMAELLDEATGLVTGLGEAVDSFTASQGGAIGSLLLEARSALDEAEKTLHAIHSTWPFSGEAPHDEALEPVPPQPPAD
ncbi:MAG TPA: MlaD family protein [Gammaproteobacteria bacterium]